MDPFISNTLTLRRGDNFHTRQMIELNLYRYITLSARHETRHLYSGLIVYFIFFVVQVFVGDFNGDKNLDLLCKNSESGQGRTVALSDGSAGFKVRQ